MAVPGIHANPWGSNAHPDSPFPEQLQRQLTVVSTVTSLTTGGAASFNTLSIFSQTCLFPHWFLFVWFCFLWDVCWGPLTHVLIGCLFFLLKNTFISPLFYVCGCFACLVLPMARGRCWVVWNRSYRRLWATLWVLGSKPRFARATNTLNCRASSPALLLLSIMWSCIFWIRSTSWVFPKF